jgi:DNA-binding IclR family transcriptional regulator
MSESSQTLARGLQLLDRIADGREGAPVRDLAAAMRLPRSIVQRLLYTLEAEGFLERHPSGVGYRLAIKLWGLGCAAIRRFDVRDAARPALEALAAKSSEMTKIGVLDRHDVVYVDGIDCQHPVRAYVPIGGRAPAHSVATGKAILAFLPSERLADIAATMKRYTRRTVVGRDAFAAEIAQIRRRGYAVNRGEWEDGVGAIAAPVLDARGEPVASIGIILPAIRLSAAKASQMAAWTVAAAAEVSRRLGHQEEPRAKRIG